MSEPLTRRASAGACRESGQGREWADSGQRSGADRGFRSWPTLRQGILAAAFGLAAAGTGHHEARSTNGPGRERWFEFPPIECLVQNIRYVHRGFETRRFCAAATAGLEPLGLMQRGLHVAAALQRFLPGDYAEALAIILASLTPAQTEAEQFGLAEFFYLPPSFYISEYGQDEQYNSGADPFDASMAALHALTTRFTAEFAIRAFLISFSTPAPGLRSW